MNLPGELGMFMYVFGIFVAGKVSCLGSIPSSISSTVNATWFGDCLSCRGLKSRSADRWLKSEVPASVAHWKLLSS